LAFASLTRISFHGGPRWSALDFSFSLASLTVAGFLVGFGLATALWISVYFWPRCGFVGFLHLLASLRAYGFLSIPGLAAEFWFSQWLWPFAIGAWISGARWPRYFEYLAALILTGFLGLDGLATALWASTRRWPRYCIMGFFIHLASLRRSGVLPVIGLARSDRVSAGFWPSLLEDGVLSLSGLANRGWVSACFWHTQLKVACSVLDCSLDCFAHLVLRCAASIRLLQSP
jgi:hypothetical protein